MDWQTGQKSAPLNGLAEDNLRVLQAGLTRVDCLVRREVRRWQLAGQDMDDLYRGLVLSDAQANDLLARPPFLSWGQTVHLPGEEQQAWEREYRRAERAARGLDRGAEAGGGSTCLAWLAKAFQLDAFDMDAFLVCLAPCLDLRYERLYGYLQDDLTHKQAGVNLILDLLCAPGPKKLLQLAHFTPSAPLIRYRLLEFSPEQSPSRLPLLGCPLTVSETVFAWLFGAYQPAPLLAGVAALSDPADSASAELLAGEPLARCREILARTANPVFVFSGPDEAAQTAAAQALARQNGQALLSVDLSAAPAESPIPLQTVQAALRDARLFNALPFLKGWDALLADGRPSPALLEPVRQFPGTLIVAGKENWIASGITNRRSFHWQSFPNPDYRHRKALWAHFLSPDQPDQTALDQLSGQFSLSTGQIRDAAASAQDAANSRACSDGQIASAGLFSAARAHSNPGLTRLARKLSPRYDWDDIILPADALAQLREIASAVRGRPIVLDDWGLGRKLTSSRGVTVLFSGPPGAGKTMAGEILGGALGLDLYKIDLAGVISKYIGETEKNLEEIFTEAENSNVILFFDEADALFGKRSEVKDSHDRYANIEISYLLQRMEAYGGVAILATNLRANLDEAFARRLQFAVDFPFPDEADRLRIWQTLLPADLPTAEDLNLPLLARAYKLAGGGIRNILVSAAYLAAANGGRVTMAHLLHGARREMQKMGKLLED